MVEILRISSFLMVFFYLSLRLGHISALASLTQFTTEMPLRYLKYVYPLCQTEEAVSKFTFETASLKVIGY